MTVPELLWNTSVFLDAILRRTNESFHPRRSWIALAALTLVAAGLATVGYWRIFTLFAPYDDEGGFLWSLNAYCTHGGLYDRVDSLYGPFYFVFNHLLYLLLGLRFNHDTGRLLTLCFWMGTVLACGALTWGQTRSLWLAMATEALSFICLITTIREPMHPSGLLTLIVAAAVLVGHICITHSHPRAFAVTATLLGSAMVLTKINVGTYFLIATGSWFAINSRSSLDARASTFLTALAAVAVPALLMRAQWNHSWVATYAIVFASGALTLTPALHDARRPEFDLRSIAWSVALALMLVSLVVLGASLNGTHWANLWTGVVAVPMAFSKSNYWPLSWLPGVRELALFQAVLVLLWYRFRAAAWTASAIAALRIAVGLWFIVYVGLHALDATAVQNFCFQYGPSLAWVMVAPLTSESPKPLGRSRLWVAWVFIWQTLQAYPVVGSQIGWGSFLWIPVLVAGCHEAADFWARRLRSGFPAFPVIPGFALASVAILALVPIARTGYESFHSNEALRVSGAARLRLAGDLASDFGILDQNIRAHGGVLFTYPASFSLNVWSGHPAPVLPRGPLEAYERALVDALERDPRAVVVINASRLKSLANRGLPLSETLIRYLTDHFVSVLRLAPYELWVHRGRQVVPYSFAHLLPGGTAGQRKLEFTIEALPVPVAAIEFAVTDASTIVLQRFLLDSTRSWEIDPVTPSGIPMGSSTVGTGPLRVLRPSRVVLPLGPESSWPKVRGIEILLLDSESHVLTRLRLAEETVACVAP